MASKKLKQRCGEGNGGDDEPNSRPYIRITRTSHTTHPLYLPTFHVVQMSVLSKRWRCMSSWTCVPLLYFEEFKDVTFRKNGKCQLQMFFKFVYYCLKSLKHHMKVSKDSIRSKFKLDMHYHHCFGCTTAVVIDNLLKFAVKENVEELDLCIEPSQKMHYCLHQSVLNSQSLTILKLESLRLEIAFPISLPSLKTLYLKYAEFDDYMTFQNLISGLPYY